MFDVRLIEDTDPLNQYGPYLMRHGLTVEFRVPFNKIKQTYKNAPYRPQLLVITSGGVRIVQVPESLTLTQAELEQTNAIHEMWQVVNCRDWALSDAFWSGSRYNPIWTVDPGPDEEIHQYWETVVEGLAASEAVAIDDLGGRRLAIVEPTAKGGLAGYTVLARRHSS